MDYLVKKEKVICKKLNIFIHSSSIFETMPRRPDKFLPENELSSLIRDELIRSLLPDPLNDAVYHNHLSDLPTLAELFSGLQYLNPRSIGSAGRLPIAGVITEFLNYPESSFLVKFRMTPESFWALVEPLRIPVELVVATGRAAFQQIAVALGSWISRRYI